MLPAASLSETLLLHDELGVRMEANSLLLRKAEIGYFHRAVDKQYIGRLEVVVYNRRRNIGVQVFQCTDNLHNLRSGVTL